MAHLWTRVVTTLCLSIIWTGKQRTGVVQHLTVDEYLHAEEAADTYVITARKHKTGDKEPATIVLSHHTYNLMSR